MEMVSYNEVLIEKLCGDQSNELTKFSQSSRVICYLISSVVEVKPATVTLSQCVSRLKHTIRYTQWLGLLALTLIGNLLVNLILITLLYVHAF
jgi:uncharacterized SAM-dependent methyltransferase